MHSTFKTFFQLLCFSFSQTNASIFCSFSLDSRLSTNYRKHWQSNEGAELKLASSLRTLPDLIFHPTRRFGISTCCLNIDDTGRWRHRLIYWPFYLLIININDGLDIIQMRIKRIIILSLLICIFEEGGLDSSILLFGLFWQDGSRRCGCCSSSFSIWILLFPRASNHSPGLDPSVKSKYSWIRKYSWGIACSYRRNRPTTQHSASSLTIQSCSDILLLLSATIVKLLTTFAIYVWDWRNSHHIYK